jgi:hypothetical protein
MLTLKALEILVKSGVPSRFLAAIGSVLHALDELIRSSQKR